MQCPLGSLWIHDAVPQSVYILTCDIMLHLNTCILNTSDPPSIGKKSKHFTGYWDVRHKICQPCKIDFDRKVSM